MFARRLLFSLVVLAGCPQAEPTESTNQIIESACLDGGTVHVKFDGCLSSSCDTLTSAECTVTVTGTNGDITGIATIESVGSSCSRDCGYIEADCELPAEAETLSINGEETTPVSDVAACGEL
jgi:hypothetical protein